MSAALKVKDAIKFDIEILQGPHAGLKLSFDKPSITIGRGPENDVVLSNDPRVSRQHAEIKRRGPSEFMIVNISAKNFILLDGQNVQSELITNDSLIQIGDSEIRFKADIFVVAPEPALSIAPVSTSTATGIPASAPVFSQNQVSATYSSTPSVHSVQAPVMPLNGSPPMPAPAMSQEQPGQGMAGYGGYQGPKPGPIPSSSGGLLQNPKARFYGIIGVLVLVAWFLFSSGKKVKTDPNAIRSSSISMKDMADAEKRNQELLTVKKEKYDSLQYRRAQENFIKGFRDYQQGQYARARESFQVVLNLDPENELAKRYYHLSKIKFDELVKFNMMQGNRYREKKNWRMCQSNYSNVMTMLQYRKDDPTYKEAKQFFEECTLNVEGRY